MRLDGYFDYIQRVFSFNQMRPFRTFEKVFCYMFSPLLFLTVLGTYLAKLRNCFIYPFCFGVELVIVQRLIIYGFAKSFLLPLHSQSSILVSMSLYCRLTTSV